MNTCENSISGINKIIVPLDVATTNDAVALAKRLCSYVGVFKIGLELLMSEGIAVIERITALGSPIFLDTKLHDIPNTVAGAARGVVRLNVAMFNVHAFGGFDMMRTAIDAAHEESTRLGVSRPLVLAVTVLTSVDSTVLAEQLRIPNRVEDQVVHLAKLARKAGLDGVVASPRESVILRKELPEEMLIVTPGIRPSWAAAQDQKRITTPADAVRGGATYIVVGRPITKPPSSVGSPEDAAIAIGKEITNALAE